MKDKVLVPTKSGGALYKTPPYKEAFLQWLKCNVMELSHDQELGLAMRYLIFKWSEKAEKLADMSMIPMSIRNQIICLESQIPNKIVFLTCFLTTGVDQQGNTFFRVFSNNAELTIK